jgi:hypothetical protein
MARLHRQRSSCRPRLWLTVCVLPNASPRSRPGPNRGLLDQVAFVRPTLRKDRRGSVADRGTLDAYATAVASITEAIIAEAGRHLAVAASEDAEIILFGSVRVRPDRPHSDLDFPVVEPSGDRRGGEAMRLQGDLRRPAPRRRRGGRQSRSRAVVLPQQVAMDLVALFGMNPGDRKASYGNVNPRRE